ncbi:MAG: FAD-binding oxidoreductase [Actinomycetota bacterium]|nr:FAD-binding oxidoreductase [Actinomycetota bacterium]
MADVVEALRRSFGVGSVVTDPDITSGYLTDWTGRFKGEALCVLRPVNSWQVQRAVEIANSSHTPMITQGGNTGLVGGATPVRGGIVLSTQFLKGIDIDVNARVAKLSAGVTLNELNSKAREVGLRFAVDIASRESATVGGMVATNAGGIHLIRYGGTRQQLLGIETVLGNGQLIARMEGLHKDNSGYDWSSILCGSEGTLGVITAVAVKLISAALHRSVALIAVDTLSGAIRIMGDARREFSNLDAVEFMSRSGLELVQRLGSKAWPMGEIPPYALLIELEGDDVEVEDIADFLESHEDVLDAALASDARADGLWYWREQHTVAINHFGVPHKLDVAIPIGSVDSFVRYVSELLELEYPNVRSVIFGHLGDGNVHVNLLNVEESDEELDHEIFATVASYGGSISAEHGIGRAKVGDLSLTRSPQDIESMRGLKKALDPALIMNPGVLFNQVG